MSVASWCCKRFCVVPCVSFCTGHFVMVPLNITYLHCLQHSLFEHLFNLYYVKLWHLFLPLMNSFNKTEAAIVPCSLCFWGLTFFQFNLNNSIMSCMHGLTSVTYSDTGGHHSHSASGTVGAKYEHDDEQAFYKGPCPRPWCAAKTAHGKPPIF